MTDPSQFYTGLVAELYAPLRRHAYDDPRPYAKLIAEHGEPALELGCGDGDPIIELRVLGLDVEGLDSSADMLQRCRTAAAACGVQISLHHQTMQQMDTGRTYGTVFLAGPTFCLLPDDRTALLALHRIRRHLHPDGTAIVPLHTPPPTQAGDVGRVVEHTTDEGECMRVTTIARHRDDAARLLSTSLRYERWHATTPVEVEVEEREWLLHWYDQSDFGRLCGQADLVVRAIVSADGSAAPSTATDITVVLQPETT
ncbi:hypothetical protein BH23ACT9_BH23ACT9_25400 [soil metagenome]